MAVKFSKGTVTYQLPVTPMVDLVFNLLLFFIVVTRFAEEDREMGVDVPMASEAPPVTAKPPETVINIDRQGRYVTAGQMVALPELERRLHLAWVNNPGRAAVVIRADERCPWKFIANAMIACKKTDIHDYRVVTREAKSASP